MWLKSTFLESRSESMNLLSKLSASGPFILLVYLKLLVVLTCPRKGSRSILGEWSMFSSNSKMILYLIYRDWLGSITRPRSMDEHRLPFKIWNASILTDKYLGNNHRFDGCWDYRKDCPQSSLPVQTITRRKEHHSERMQSIDDQRSRPTISTANSSALVTTLTSAYSLINGLRIKFSYKTSQRSCI